MLIWLGSFIVIGAMTWIGFEWARQLETRPKQIRQLKNALQILEAEIAYSQTPLNEAFLLISKQVPQPTSSLFQDLSEQLMLGEQSFSALWEACIGRHAEMTALGGNERDIMLQFGKTLGQHDLHQQEKQLILAKSHLERELEEARTNQLRYAKMARTLGFLGGLFIVLLFI